MDHRDARNMNAVLTAMAEELSEALPAVEHMQAVGGGQALEGGQAVEDAQIVHSRWRASWRTRTLGTVAAAAAVAALILVRGEGNDPSGGLDSSAGAPPATNMMAEMDVEADKPFVVFPTSDPDIAVVWLLNPKESDS